MVERRAAVNGLLPKTALEPGYWECQVDGDQWVPYQWPTCSIIEQAYCRWKPTAEFKERGHDYCIEFQEAFTLELFVAAQVNKRTGARRSVRRLPNKCKDQHQRILKAYEDAVRTKEAARQTIAWAPWTQAQWTWMLLDGEAVFRPDGMMSRLGHDPLPSSPAPSKVPYSLACSFGDHMWPEIVRHWPTHGLVSAAHPLGERCNFSLQRITAAEAASSEGLRQEWGRLQHIWQHGGLSSKLVGAFRIQNRGLLHEFQKRGEAMLAKLSGECFTDGVSRAQQLQVQLLWHGTKAVSQLLEICSDGFDRARAQTCVYGKGCYFAKSAAYSNKYACSVKVAGEPNRKFRAMLLAIVLVGESTEGSSQMYPPPVKPHSSFGERYENTVDKMSSPTIYVTFKDNQAAPAYVMVYEA